MNHGNLVWDLVTLGSQKRQITPITEHENQKLTGPFTKKNKCISIKHGCDVN